ncbi:hypothetical protein [Paenibacillus sp. FSL R7-0026]|uniref:hypothetical protein n=1 Tax=Paenibacillus sp. FSL R7-0026 TaxID=2921668 RepID=UPI0030F5BAC6
MQNIKKISISTLATLMMILTPTQAIFADEAVTTNTVQPQEMQLSNSITLQGTEWGYVGGQTVPIYMNGEIKVVLNGVYGDICNVYAVGEYNSKKYLGQLNRKDSLKATLYGYYKIELDYAVPPLSPGPASFYVIY